jgi:hypothetical protein
MVKTYSSFLLFSLQSSFQMTSNVEERPRNCLSIRRFTGNLRISFKQSTKFFVLKLNSGHNSIRQCLLDVDKQRTRPEGSTSNVQTMMRDPMNEIAVHWFLPTFRSVVLLHSCSPNFLLVKQKLESYQLQERPCCLIFRFVLQLLSQIYLSQLH